jgi:biotin carboxylase
VKIDNLRGKKLLIIGANTETIPLVEKAKSLGVYTIVTDYNSNAPAKKHADKKIDIDGSCVSALIEFAENEKIDGVIVGVAEALLPAYQQLCEALAFPCYINKEHLETIIDKSVFKSVCIKNGVRTVPEYLDTAIKMKTIKYPVIVKPVDSCSAKGISVCYSPEEFEIGIKKALQFSIRGKYIVEKYMTGPEADVHYAIKDGVPVLSCMFDRYESSVGSGFAKLPTAFIFPSWRLDTFIKNQDEGFKKVISDIGLTNGPLFFSGFIDDNGMLACTETGHRFTGSQEPLIIEKMTGFSMMEMLIRYALTGETGNAEMEKMVDPHFKQWCCKLSPIAKEGKIAEISGLGKISKIPEIFYTLQSYYEGDVINGEGTLRQIFIRFFIATETIEKMVEVINEIQNTLSVLDEKGKSMIIQTFDIAFLDKYRK